MTHNGAPQGNTHGLKWSPDHDLALRKWFGKGYSFSQSAVKINDEFDTRFSRNACIGRAGRIGLVSALTKTRQPMISKKPDRQHPRYNGGAPRQRPPVVAPICTEIPPRHLSLSDLQPNDCRWPFGDGPFTFCGAQKHPDKSYCWHHFRLGTGVGTVSERAANR